MYAKTKDHFTFGNYSKALDNAKTEHEPILEFMLRSLHDTLALNVHLITCRLGTTLPRDTG